MKSSNSNRSRSRSRSRSRDRKKKSTKNDHDQPQSPKGFDDEEEEKHNDLTDFYESNKFRKNKYHRTMNKIMPHHCLGKYQVIIKMYYRKAKCQFGLEKPGQFEDTPTIWIAVFGFKIRVFPSGIDLNVNINQSGSIAFILENRIDLYQTGTIKLNKDHIIKCKVQLGNTVRSIQFKIGEFNTKQIVYRPLDIVSKTWKSFKSVQYTLSMDSYWFKSDNVGINFDNQLKSYSLGIKHGGLRIFSSNPNKYCCKSSITIKRLTNEENTNNNNTNSNNSNINNGNEYIKCDPSIIAGLGVPIANIVYGCGFSTGQDLIISCSLPVIQALVFYAYTNQLAISCDPFAFVAIGQYLVNRDLKKKALDRVYTVLSIETVTSVCALYTKFEIKNEEGLSRLVTWIRSKENLLQLQKVNNQTGRCIYDDLKEYPYVTNNI